MEKTTAILPLSFALLLFQASVSAEPETPPVPAIQNAEQVNESESNNEQTANQGETEQQGSESEQEASRTVEEVSPYQRYITEQLYVFMHSGGSNEYRIIGRVEAGEAVTVTAQDVESGWLQIKTSSGREGWVNNNNLVEQAGVKKRLADANQQINKLQSELRAIRNSSSNNTEELSNQVTQLTEQNTNLITQLETATVENQQLKTSMQEFDETKRVLAKLYDVGSVLIGVFFGWLLTRRKKNQWV